MTPLTQFERRLKMLKTEVDLDFPGLLRCLEEGLQIVLITENELTTSLEPDHLRRTGGMVAVCNHYGAAVVFVSEKKIARFGGSAKSAS
jgi:hypothetical protein